VNWPPHASLVRYILAILAVALPLAAFNHYVLCENHSNHTGTSPYTLLIVFIPVAAFFHSHVATP